MACAAIASGARGHASTGRRPYSAPRHDHFEKGRLENASFRGARLEGSNFEKARLTGASLAGARAQGCNFEGANLTEALLNGADLQRWTGSAPGAFREEHVTVR